MPFHYSNEQVAWSGDYTAGVCLSLRLGLFGGFCCLIPRENGNSRADDFSSGGLCSVDVISPSGTLPNSILDGFREHRELSRALQNVWQEVGSTKSMGN